jgi:hypothetical protein
MEKLSELSVRESKKLLEGLKMGSLWELSL